MDRVKNGQGHDGAMQMIAQILIGSTMFAGVASAVEPKVPARLFRVDGRPVPVSCLEGLTGPEDDARKTPIDVRTCGNTKLRPKTQADGSIGYDTPDGGYFFYSYVGRSGDLDILSLQNSGGGTGRFTQLVGVRQRGHIISWVKDIAGGDRCNGGISGARISNGRLLFDEAITPYDLIALARPKGQLKAYHDLEDSAASCIGLVHRVGDDAHWTGATLTEHDWRDQKGWTDQYRYQACFNDLYRKAVADHPMALDQRAVVMFAHTFTTHCVQKR